MVLLLNRNNKIAFIYFYSEGKHEPYDRYQLMDQKPITKENYNNVTPNSIRVTTGVDFDKLFNNYD